MFNASIDWLVYYRPPRIRFEGEQKNVNAHMKTKKKKKHLQRKQKWV